MRTNYCTELKTFGQMVINAIPTGDGRYTTGEYVDAFWASLKDDISSRKKAQEKATMAA